MAPAIPKLSGSSTFKPWWENFTRVIRMKRIVSFLLDPDTTIEEAEDSYAKYGYASLTASAPPSAASLAAPAPPSAGGSRRTTRGSSANTAPAVQAAAPPDAELVRKRRAEFIAAIEKVTEMLYDSVDTELFKNFTNGEDTKQMIHRLKILHEPKPGVVAATVEAEYVALMRTASFKNLGEWIDKWGRIMQTKIAEKVGDIHNDNWKINLADKFSELGRSHEAAAGLITVESCVLMILASARFFGECQRL